MIILSLITDLIAHFYSLFRKVFFKREWNLEVYKFSHWKTKFNTFLLQWNEQQKRRRRRGSPSSQFAFWMAEVKVYKVDRYVFILFQPFKYNLFWVYTPSTLIFFFNFPLKSIAQWHENIPISSIHLEVNEQPSWVQGLWDTRDILDNILDDRHKGFHKSIYGVSNHFTVCQDNKVHSLL